MKKQTNNADQDKKYLQALKESDERFRSIVLWSPDAIIVTDVEGKIEYMNPTAEKVFNRKLESFVGKDFGLAIVNGESTEIDIVRPGKDTGVGEMYVVETEWLGEKAHLITIRDITDRKKAEEALRESENKYRLLANNVHDVIFVLDMNLKYTYISPSVKILRGYEPEELLQQTPAGMLTPSSMDLAMKTIAETMELEKTEHREINVSRTLQLEMIRKDGTTVWTEVKFSLIRDENQQLVNIMGVTRDITERKQAERALLESEEKYRLVVENAKESIIITQDMKLVFVNNAAISMVGYSKEILTLKSFTDFIHPDDRNMVVDHHIKRIKGEEVPTVYYFRVIGQDGTVIWCELNAAVIQWKGKPATLNFLNNITERRKSEEELKQTLESLRKSIGATIQTMVSAVEMRDPYTAGHQLRVADLACSIAAEIGLPQDKIDGIRMAGSIHDIGKLSIPSEI